MPYKFIRLTSETLARNKTISDGSSFQNSSVQSWVNDHPSDPSLYEVTGECEARMKKKKNPHPQLIPPSYITLHQAEFLSQIPPKKCSKPGHLPKARNKRPRLAVISGNSMNPPDKADDDTPAAGVKSRARHAPRTFFHQAFSLPTSHGSQDFPRSGSSYVTSSEQTPRSSETKSTATSVKKRGPSPARTRKALQCADIPVSYVLIGEDSSISKDARRLLAITSDQRPAKDVVPPNLRQSLHKYLAGLYSEDYANSVILTQDFTHIQPDLEEHYLWRRVSQILRNAESCHIQNSPEPEWTGKVHCPLFELVLNNPDRRPGEVDHHVVTTARIADKTLLPGTAKYNRICQSKMVDICMVINPTRELSHRIRQRIRDGNLDSINQSNAAHLLYKPIGISVETKTPGTGQAEAENQVATWVFAHFTNLERIRRGGDPLPNLPLIIVQGHHWQLKIAEMIPDQELLIYHGFNIGDTASHLGIFRLRHALSQLARWISTTYQPWFEKNVLCNED
ncbi:MAG: hypothetical protein Q9219_005311 [cf. Caloplaca sp. 3 TL-2023]